MKLIFSPSMISDNRMFFKVKINSRIKITKEFLSLASKKTFQKMVVERKTVKLQRFEVRPLFIATAHPSLCTMPGRMSTWSFPQVGRLSTLYKGELFVGQTVKCTMCSLFSSQNQAFFLSISSDLHKYKPKYPPGTKDSNGLMNSVVQSLLNKIKN